MFITAHHPLVKLCDSGPELLSPFRIARADLATIAGLRQRLRLRNGRIGSAEAAYWTAELRELLCRVLASGGAAADGGGELEVVRDPTEPEKR